MDTKQQIVQPQSPASKTEPVAEKQALAPPLVPAGNIPADDIPAPKLSATNPQSGGSSKNAQKHGAYARGNVVISDEPREEYDALHAAHLEEFWPEGAAEEACVRDVTNAEWIKRRLEHSIL